MEVEAPISAASRRSALRTASAALGLGSFFIFFPSFFSPGFRMWFVGRFRLEHLALSTKLSVCFGELSTLFQPFRGALT